MLRALPSVPIASIKRFTSRGLYTCYAVTRHVTLSTHLPRSHNISLRRYLVCHRAGTAGGGGTGRGSGRLVRAPMTPAAATVSASVLMLVPQRQRARERLTKLLFTSAQIRLGHLSARPCLFLLHLHRQDFSLLVFNAGKRRKKTNKQKQNGDSFRLTGHPLVPRRSRPLTAKPRPSASRAFVPSHAFSWPVPSPFSPLRVLRSARAYKGSSEDRTLPFLIVASLSSSVIMSALQ